MKKPKMTTKENYKGYMIEIEQDDCDEYNNPRLWGNLGTMICHHGRYTLGDEHDYTIQQVMYKVKQKDIISLPLYLYDHGGITMRAHPFE